MQDNRREFLSDCARYIKGDISQIRLRGNKDDCILFATALKESRNLFEKLNEDNTSVSNVMNALTKKREATRKLSRHVGFAWPF
jgi:hypothetical protein